MILSGRRTLRSTVAHGISVGSWNTKPIRPAVRRRGLVGPVDRAARRRAQARDQPQRGRLAAARRPEQRHELARPDIEIETIERRHAARERLADIVERDDRNTRDDRGNGGVDFGHAAIIVRGRTTMEQRLRHFRKPVFGQERDPALDFGGVKLGKRLHAKPGRLEADGAEFLLHLGLAHHLDDRGAELFTDVVRQAGRAVDAEPAGRGVRPARRLPRTSAHRGSTAAGTNC